MIPGAPADQFARGGLGRPSGVVYVISSDGMLHVMGLPSGKDIQKPVPFVPANSRWSDPIAIGTMLYTSTSGGCGGAPDAVWAIDLASESKPVVSWKSEAPLVGSLAFTTDGTLVAVTGPAIVTLDAKTLQAKDTLKALGSDFVTGPTILQYGENEVIAAGSMNGHVFLFRLVDGTPSTATDSDFPSGSIVATGPLAAWQTMEAPVARWLLAPTKDAVAALQFGEPPQLPAVTRGWTAANLTSPATPVVVNGVVFVLERGSSAVLHAYDGMTGNELWTSGTTITAAAAPGSFWSANGQIYVGTLDGTLYAFGFNDERR